MYHVYFERFHHSACGAGGSGDYERAIASFGVHHPVFKQRADFESVSHRYEIAQLGAGYQSSVAVVSFFCMTPYGEDVEILWL